MADTADLPDGRVPRPGSRVSRRREKTREQVLLAAEQAFRDNAYADVRMEDLAEIADVSIGSIYDHFGSKNGLYLALAERALEQFADYIEQASDPAYSPLEQVLAAGDAYLRFHLEHPGSFRFLALDAIDTQVPPLEDGSRQRVGLRLEGILAVFEGHIQAAMVAHEADGSFDARLAARFLWGAWNGVVSMSLRKDRMALSETDVAACLQLGRRLVRDGLTAPEFRTADGQSRARLVDTGRDRAAT